MQTQQAAPTPSVAVELDARETHWHVAADLAVPGCGLQWEIPGPTIEASVGDTPVVRCTTRCPNRPPSTGKACVSPRRWTAPR